MEKEARSHNCQRGPPIAVLTSCLPSTEDINLVFVYTNQHLMDEETSEEQSCTNQTMWFGLRQGGGEYTPPHTVLNVLKSPSLNMASVFADLINSLLNSFQHHIFFMMMFCVFVLMFLPICHQSPSQNNILLSSVVQQ